MKYLCIVLLVLGFVSCGDDINNKPEKFLSITRILIDGQELTPTGPNTGISTNKLIEISFDMGIDLASAELAISITPQNGSPIARFLTLSNLNKRLTIDPETDLQPNQTYSLFISESLMGDSGESFKETTYTFTTSPEALRLTSFKIDNIEVSSMTRITEVSTTPVITLRFSKPIAPEFANSSYFRILKTSSIPCSYQLSESNSVLTLTPTIPLTDITKYQIFISGDIKGTNAEYFNTYINNFYTAIDPTPKFPLLTDDELLTKVQQQTFKYFYDYAEPNSGLARERIGSGNLVTTGGSGFGLMAMVVAIERNFITRQQGIDRLNKIVSFLETADRFHGAWSHWVNGSTGKVIPFSTKDNGGDLVETSFLVQGLLTFRQYLVQSDTVGNNLINRITNLYNDVEWDWYRKDNSNVLYWHWSPNYGWEMNFALSGYFEQQITYVLAAASPTHGIPKIVYSNGYGQNGAIVRNNTYYGYNLPLGGLFPLFWTQYSYLGLDPNFSDGYANYWTQNRNASLINNAYCAANPKKYVGYSADCWGLTSSDNQNGYDAHSPANDLGVITPTAALSAFPYTPEESMKALRFFYYTLGDRLWGEYGFYDAFNLTQGWTASSYLAIDQGPIIVMIENYRTGLLWDLFMSCPEIQQAEVTLGFSR